MTISLDDLEKAGHDAWGCGDTAAAFRKFKKGADQGHLGCLFDLAYFYDTGIHVKPNKPLAMKLYKKVYRCNLYGDASAANNIAILYREVGRYDLTFKWFLRAAELGDGNACVDVAKCLASGVGTRVNNEKAIRYIREALSSASISDDGLEEAEFLLKQYTSST